jgi:predicted TIM-barrel enzyme
VSGAAEGASVCDGRWRLVERLAGAAEETVWRADPAALVAVGWDTGVPADELASALALPHGGVTPLLAAGRLDGTDRQVLVEALPAGRPRDRAADLATARRWGARTAAIAAGAHAAGDVLGGIRPEAVRIAGDAVAAIAPRATRLWELRDTDVGVVPGYAELYRSPERLSGAGVSAADDVFAIAATVVAWATGAHAFAGATPGERDASLLTGRRASFSGPPSVALLLAAALGAAPGRPAAGALAAGLTAS